MKKYYYIILLILFFGLLSCSNEETKTQNQVAARPTVPIQNGEVQIGTQIWMTKNLNVSRYRNGDPIPQVANSAQWANLNTGAWCYYANSTANGPIYGKLYNWYAVNDSRGLAPEGWHIPSDAEWTTLVSFLGFPDVAGGKMKTTGTLQVVTDYGEVQMRRLQTVVVFQRFQVGMRLIMGGIISA
ncbi:MAG: fibrobacter succinogenes major paralogous domain-containing protein [Flavobacterium sp.]|nr:fibrobacter succinogenes major paralogous domain-containing protein [Flavobacterium sp.]